MSYAFPTRPRRGQSGKMTRADRIRQRTKGHCAYCGQYVPREKMTRDHVVPMSKGGATILANLVCACETCNQLKADMMLEEFRARHNGGDAFWFESLRD